MANWFEKLAPKLFPAQTSKSRVPAGLWSKCPRCSETIYSKDLEKSLKVCFACGYHMPVSAKERVEMTFDRDSFEEFNASLATADPLQFSDSKRYKDRLRQSRQKTGMTDAVITGKARVKELPLIAAVFEFGFMGGSMGAVVGEKIALATEKAIAERLPLLIVSCSGGARMQEGTVSLMQMAKTSMAVKRLKNERLPYVSLLTHPTTGGVTASFAMLGDVILAEPASMIGFAGPRVIKETIKKDLPEGFQTAEFLFENGSIDRVVPRSKLRDELHLLFFFMTRERRIE